MKLLARFEIMNNIVEIKEQNERYYVFKNNNKLKIKLNDLDSIKSIYTFMFSKFLKSIKKEL